MSGTSSENRILIISREQEFMDQVTRVLEAVGCIVTGTLNDEVAIDLAGSGDFDAMLIGGEVSQLDGGYVRFQAKSHKPSMPVVLVHHPDSVLTQLRHAGILF